MRTLVQFIKEEAEKTPSTERGKIKFTIWETPDKKVRWVKDNNAFTKIEYKLEDNKKKLYIDFLLGFKDNSWKLWIGKIGATTYDSDPYCDFETKSFAHAIVNALDKVEEFLEQVEEDPINYVQFYKNL